MQRPAGTGVRPASLYLIYAVLSTILPVIIHENNKWKMVSCPKSFESRPGVKMLSQDKKHHSAIFNMAFITLILFLMHLLLISCSPKSTKTPAIPPGIQNDPFRIAYYEGGPYIDYAEAFRATVHGLTTLGWMEPLDIPDFEGTEDMSSVWQYAAENTESDYLVFVEDAFWSANWDDQERAVIRQDAVHRLSELQDIDLVLAMGTWAGQDLVNDLHHTATLNLTSSNPIQAGILSSAESSEYDHVLVEVDPERYVRSIRLFHEVVDFSRLGVVYENSSDGRIYANYEELQQASEENNFKLVECFAADTNMSEAEAYENVQKCYSELAPVIDALWTGANRGENHSFMPQSLEVLLEHNIPTWSNLGREAVRRGILISIWQADYDYAGSWYAEKIGQILNGAKPGDLDQILELPQHIVINLETARRIGFEFPPGILEIADEAYETIEGEYETQDTTSNQ